MSTFNPDMSNRLASLEKRLIVTEVQLETVRNQLEMKHKLWAKVRSELADMALFFTVFVLTLLVLSHYFN